MSFMSYLFVIFGSFDVLLSHADFSTSEVFGGLHFTTWTFRKFCLDFSQADEADQKSLEKQQPKKKTNERNGNMQQFVQQTA